MKENLMDISTASAFMYNGLSDSGALSNLATLEMGLYEIVAALVSHAEYCGEICADAESLGAEFPGVFDYEVSIRFGRWFGNFLMSHRRFPSKEKCQAKLDELSKAFFFLTNWSGKKQVEGC